jgi:sigma-54 dependent transcriptional regulator, acetoin dehydrogenase operon transcriptional activator AcoR
MTSASDPPESPITEVGHGAGGAQLAPVLVAAGHAGLGGGCKPEGRRAQVVPAKGLLLGRRVSEALRRSELGPATLTLTHPRASGSHARIERKGEQFWLHDLGSTNGTWLNGRRLVEPAPLMDGDWMFLGGEAFVFRWLSCEDQAALDAEAAAPLSAVPTRSPRFARVLQRLRLLAETPAEVLLVGETGVGKEVYAQAIHRQSRRTGAFVAINCAAIPPELVESELFGFMRGAHSQATQAKAGVIEQAQLGTLFLDEIGDMPAAAQAKLLRFVQTKEIWPLGASQSRRIDVRIVAATSHPHTKSESPGVRDDLMGRLGASPLPIPPLAARREDLGAFIAHFAQLASKAQPVALEADAFFALMAYPWPRNVRELQAVITEAVVFAQGAPLITRDHLPSAITGLASPSTPPSEPASPPPEFATTSPQAARSPRPMPSKAEMEALLATHGGNIAHVARQLNRQWKVVKRAVARYGIDVARFRDPSGS